MSLTRRFSKSVRYQLGIFGIIVIFIIIVFGTNRSPSNCSLNSHAISERRMVSEGSPESTFNLQQELHGPVRKNNVRHIEGTGLRYQIGDLIFATAGSADHYREMIDAIASVQTYFPSNRILFYDLGINTAQVRNVTKMCSVEYRNFSFDRYPEHVRKLKLYAWKALLLKELVDEFEAVLWFDASIRFKSNGINQVLKKASKNGGVSSMINSGHSIFAATHEATYNYLPVNLTKARTTYMIASGLLYFQRTPLVRNVILPQWSACALQRGCIAPIDTIICNFKDKKMMEYFADCHRFEQAALSIILARHFHYELGSYYVSYYSFATVKRGVSNWFNISYCPHALTGVWSKTF